MYQLSMFGGEQKEILKKKKKKENIGEEDEYRAVLSLIYWRDNQPTHIYCDGTHEIIHKVGYYTKISGYRDYYPYGTHDLSLDEIKKLNKESLIKISKQCGFSKAPNILKADVCINNENISLKSKRGNSAALINHTHRAGIEKVCTRIPFDIKLLDNAIMNYWRQRKKGTIKQDVDISTEGNPFECIKHELKILLKYFLFTGSARGNSPVKADKLIEFSDPTDFSTWKIFSQEKAVEYFINKLNISIVSKAIPATYRHNPPISARDKSIKIWTKFYQNKYKGSFHVRG